MTTMTDPPAIPTQNTNVPQQRSRTSRDRNFVSEIEKTCKEDAGARAALRSGLRKDLNSVPRMHRFIAKWLAEDERSGDKARAYYAVAAMIASQPRSSYATTSASPDEDAAASAAPDDATAQPAHVARRYGTSLGATFAIAVTKGPGREKQMRGTRAEGRLNLLTRQSVNGLHRHLPASVSYLRSLDVPVDWVQLLGDLSNWRRHSGRISRRWLQDFYRLYAQSEHDRANDDDVQELMAPAPAETHTN
jgi:CRISPR type I-E/ECOLI-associated protein CasB/Cse2